MQFSSNITQSYCGNLQETNTMNNNTLPTLEESFQNAFQNTNNCILILKDYSMSIQKYNNRYYTFDPHSRNNQGLPTANGNAILATFLQKQHLFNYI